MSSSPTLPTPEVPKVLIVDDSRTMRRLVRRANIMAGVDEASIIEAENGRHALDLVHEHAPRVIISDVVMPEMTGVELIEALDAEHILQDLCVIMITSQPSPEVLTRLGECGINTVINKPFAPDALHQVLSPIVQALESQAQIDHEYEAPIEGQPPEDRSLIDDLVTHMLEEWAFVVASPLLYPRRVRTSGHAVESTSRQATHTTSSPPHLR